MLLAVSGSALAADPVPADGAGFYGGISMRDAGREGDGISVGHLSSVWSRFALPLADESGSRALAYGGYRWGNDVAVETRRDTRPLFAATCARGRAAVASAWRSASDNDGVGKAFNVDVYTSWEFRKSFSLYGRLGYAQSETQAAYAPAFASDVVRRNRDGVNYGLGLRYDMTRALGLRVEYARFGRLPGEFANGLMPENDQVQLGVQFRF